MKKLNFLFVVSFLFFSTTTLKAQFVLEATYDTASVNLWLVNLELSGEKYVRTTGYATDRKIYLYNLDHSLWKTIDCGSMPVSHDPFGAPLWSNYTVLYISENLFNTDPMLEFMYFIPGAPGPETTIYDELGNTLFFADSCSPNVKLVIPIVHKPIYATASGTKMILSHQNGTARVYGLAGTLTEMVDEYGGDLKMTTHPNPAKDFTVLDYQLPPGIKEGTVEIYDLNGSLFKSYIVDDAFKNLMISTSELASGYYNFVLKTTEGVVTRKQIIIK